MNCEAAGVLLVQIGRNALLDAKLRSLALDHARDCRTCGARLARERALTAGLTMIAAEDHTAAPSPAVFEALMSAHHDQFARKQRMRVLWSASTALAACLAIFSVIRTVDRSRVAADPMVQLEARTPEMAALLTNSDEGAAPAANSDEFVPIPYSEPLSPDERTELQSVRMTRAMLTALGLTSNNPDPDEPVNAEIVVGEDGVPRAVRVLN